METEMITPAQPAGSVDNPPVQWLRAESGQSDSSWSATLLRWLMPAAGKAAGVAAGVMLGWLLMAAVLLVFAMLGGMNVSAASLFHRPVLVQRQRASIPGA